MNAPAFEFDQSQLSQGFDGMGGGQLPQAWQNVRMGMPHQSMGLSGQMNPFRETYEQQQMAEKASELRRFEENEKLMERMVQQVTNAAGKQAEEALKEQKARDRAAYLEELQRIQ